MATGTLASLEDVKDAMNIPRGSTTYDKPLTLALGIANQRILDYTKNSLIDIASIVELHKKIQQGAQFYLELKPVGSIVTVKVRDLGQVLQDASYDLTDPKTGEVILLTAAASWPPSSVVDVNAVPWYKHLEKIWDIVEVSYSVTGWQPNQSEKNTAALFAVYLYQRGAEGAKKSKGQSALAETYLAMDMPPWVEGPFAKYRRHSVRVF